MRFLRFDKRFSRPNGHPKEKDSVKMRDWHLFLAALPMTERASSISFA
jgi:hypothetical protein